MVTLMIIKLLSHIQIFNCPTPCAKNHTLSLFQHENSIFQFRSYFKCGITYRLEGMKLLGSSNWMALKRLSFRFISSISCDFLKIWKLIFGMLSSKNCSWHWTFTLFFEIPIWLSEGGISLHKEGSQLFWRLCWPVQTFLTSVSTKKILESKLSGTSSPNHIERYHVMAYAVSKEVSCKSRLQRSYDKQILTPAALYKFCEESIPNMNFNFQETRRMRQRRET